jgi:heterodisulfide reductase subunit A
VNTSRKHVAVIGAGVAGLTAAEALAGWGVQVSLLEKSNVPGGHAIQLSCKATDACVKCGACMAEDKLQRAIDHPQVALYTGTQIASISGKPPYHVNFTYHSSHKKAEPIEEAASIRADAVLLATGFSTYHPVEKPYGYGQFPNVITSLEAERMLRAHGCLKRPSDGRPVKRMAFIQCVGSRDASLKHNWCSAICCGSSMRMARLIQFRQEAVQICFFYIDIQTFGRDFNCFYDHARDNLDMIRTIPGEISRTAADALEVIYFDPHTNSATEALFDVVVLSVGLIPSTTTKNLAQNLQLPLDEHGFVSSHGYRSNRGIFTAGAVTGPMSIAESVSSAEKSVYDLVRFLGVVETGP